MLYSTLDLNLAVFLLERLSKLRYNGLALQGLLAVRTIWIGEKGRPVSFQEFARHVQRVKRQLVLDKRERDLHISREEGSTEP